MQDLDAGLVGPMQVVEGQHDGPSAPIRAINVANASWLAPERLGGAADGCRSSPSISAPSVGRAGGQPGDVVLRNAIAGGG